MIKNLFFKITVISLLILIIIPGIIQFIFELYYKDRLISAYFSAQNCPPTRFHLLNNETYYSQFYEDYILAYIFENKENGTYVDVGTNDPNSENATKYFYNLGWRGVNFEPQLKHYNLLLKYRPEDININKAVSDENGKATFHIPRFDKTASLGQKEGVNYEKIEVETVTLTTVFKELNLNKIDFLKIDVEGFEHKVMQGLDLNIFRPSVIVLESISPLDFRGYLKFEPILFKHNYRLGMSDDLNRYYYSAENKEIAELFRKMHQCVTIDKLLRGASCINEDHCTF